MTTLENLDKCPKCGSSWDGGSIAETFKKMKAEGNTYYGKMTDEEIDKLVEESYAPPYRWGRQIGIELPYDHPNHYDGVSYWQCPDCNTTWNRFTRKEEEIPCTK